MDSERRPDSAEAFREQQVDRLAAEEDMKWAHHASDLEQDRGVQTRVFDRPMTVLTRTKVLSDALGLTLFPLLLDLPERYLSARHPYQSSPLSYLNAMGSSWSLWAEGRKLEWAESGAADSRYGGMQFWFRDVEPGRQVLVAVSAVVGALPGATGSVEIRSSEAGPRSFPVTGLASHTFDVLLRPSDPFAALVTLEIKAGVGYFAFESIAYNQL